MINWVVAALLIVAALFFIVPTLLRRRTQESVVLRDRSNLEIYRDQLADLEADLRNDTITQDQFEQSKLELERRLLEEVHIQNPETTVTVRDDTRVGKGAAVVIALLFPALATMVYVINKNPDILTPQQKLAQEQMGGDQPSPEQMQADAQAQAQAMQSMEELLIQLAERMKQNPDDPRGWLLLGRSYFEMGRFQEAVGAYEQAIRLMPDDADVLADYADALGMAQGRSLAGKPMEIINQALQMNPDSQKALWLAGTAAYESKDYAGAIRNWERLLRQFPPDSEVAQTMQANIDEARRLSEGKGGTAIAAKTDGGQAAQAKAAAPAAQLAGVVSLSPSLAGKVKDTDIVFIFARAAQGPRMPLAVLRKQVKDLPITFKLDDSMAAMPAMRLSDATDVIVEARISKSGNAMPQSGDLEGGTGSAVKVGSSDLKIVIDRVIP